MPLPPFQALVDAHADELYRYLVASVGPDHAEDCLQETFLSALRAYPRLAHGEHLRAWLYRIAQRKAADSLRGAGRRAAGELAALRLTGSQQPQEPPDDGLWHAVRQLPDKQRQAVIHRFVFDRAYREMAGLMRTSEAAARQNVRAGLQRLRQEIDR